MQQYKYGSYGYIALRDLASARESVQTLPSVSGCCSQQAVEKMLKHYLKEVLYSDSESAMRTHEVDKLIKLSGLDFPDEVTTTLSDLSDVYFNTTYPGDDYWELDTETAYRLYAAAEYAVEFIDRSIQQHYSDNNSNRR